MSSDHFQGKNAQEHLASKKSEVATEIHGDELPGHQGSFLDALRDTTLLFMIFWSVAKTLGMTRHSIYILFIFMAIGWALWKGVRSFWISSSRLERLHRVLKEERYEIENHRPQEREELSALYEAKGFKGPLLEEVLDVLMADDERLLKIMMEEEMGLSLQNCEHPLKIALGSALGVILSSILIFIPLLWLPYWALPTVSTLTLGVSGYYIAKLQKNDTTSAFIWNLGFSILIYGVVYFSSHWFLNWK